MDIFGKILAAFVYLEMLAIPTLWLYMIDKDSRD